MKAYNFDVVSQTLILSAAFCKEMMNPQSEENGLYHRLMKEFPDMVVKKRTHSTPVKYRNSNGTVTKHNQYKGVTYERIEFFLDMLPDNENSKAIKDNYKKLRERANGVCNSPYTVVGKWFLAQFPKYKTNPLSYLKEVAVPIEISSFLEAKNNVTKFPREENQEQEKTG